ncbi:hypothetical protein EV702DRAFT_1182675 [Suillus placidus]|uniref:Uncharacterized protein n=1 Tax=Suillus placidus TaxID=48579 RepID=A0A9P7CVT1_9AGAM|nr:hypothetical protein EV702DRAFT_1182675 [Suillus placidus]
MSTDENNPSSSDPSHKRSSLALQLGPRILRLEELQDSPIEDYPAEILTVFDVNTVFMNLIDSYPGLLDRLTAGKEDDVIHIGEMLGKGASGARGDDTKTLKSAVLEWLVPRGQVVIPPLSRNIKSNRGFNHEVTGALLCPAGLDWSDTATKLSLKSGETAVRGDQWPMFLYARYEYDPEDPWKGLLRGEILIFGFKHVFTSPSSVDREPKATRAGNAYLHGMKSVTKGSLAYIATQIQYHSILDLLEDPDESEEVVDLMTWWRHNHSALSKIREKRAA